MIMSYDPTTGRWISQDPIAFQGGDTNLYRYVGNSPTLGKDPSGLWVFPWDPNANWSDWRIGEAIADTTRINPSDISDMWNTVNNAANDFANKYPPVIDPLEGGLRILESLTGESFHMTYEGHDLYPVICGVSGGGSRSGRGPIAPRPVNVFKLVPPESRPFADPDKLLRQGPFDWEKYTPIEVEDDGKCLRVLNGMTRIENAIRSGITTLPAYIYKTR
jgi:hypothetical protein